MSLREETAMAIYAAAFDPKNEEEATRLKPSPGWCWERITEEMREFARRQADHALTVVRRRKNEL